ncbi:GyrI-like domain-containing protein [Sporomusa termitida]|uniref:GyrI-like small molecule binding domain protein n=1 Tax=Sporomusa termitida TaxID=2377 RepID=A0A517DW78_9FIRM|nr:GyrI-like domain-containing protein [Sporomusa termitida]QDR81612.1 GyrI-like small molecule binding domain protein [Sporomusa termitida]
MPKVDYRKDYKDLYLPKAIPAIIDVPAMVYIMVNGQGDPKGKEYQDAVALLYALAYTIKMKGKEIAGYFEYTVFPLEGLWWCEGGAFAVNQRHNWRWIAMIRQPEFVTPAVFQWAAAMTHKKKPELDFTKPRLEVFNEGLCVQMLHSGPYANEPVTIAKMKAFMAQNGLADRTGTDRKHHEIYLSDPNRTKPEKLNTVLRLPVSK